MMLSGCELLLLFVLVLLFMTLRFVLLLRLGSCRGLMGRGLSDLLWLTTIARALSLVLLPRFELLSLPFFNQVLLFDQLVLHFLSFLLKILLDTLKIRGDLRKVTLGLFLKHHPSELQGC